MQFASVFCRRGRGDIADLLPGGRKRQRFLFSLSENVPGDLKVSKALFQELRAAMLDGCEARELEYYDE